ncbi:trypsin-like serine peptidase [Amycolatopsis pigmentata]|uniref:Trypsin-like serine peptidase n=1 Tax=Amycolatopsis pigmentata TaxID=450801 RepID=A0ABW5FTQ4_9PSEU
MRSLRPVSIVLSFVLLAVVAALPVPASEDGPRPSHYGRTGPPDVSQVSSTKIDSASVSPTVGALFVDGSHYCSASVVHSPRGDLVLTAAHCIHEGDGGDYRTGVTFVPGYHDGTAPYGVWTATQLIVDHRWADSSDSDLDVGFLVVHQAGNPRPLESETGANQLGTNHGFVNTVVLSGYSDDSEEPTACRNVTGRQDSYQMRIDCPGFQDGTSGGPWVTGAASASDVGTVIGVIGGYQLGGDSPDVSYSSYFDDDIAALYAEAADS